MLKLMLIDDEPLVLAGLKSMVDWKSLGVEIVGTAANGHQGFERISQWQPDLVLTDIKMPMMTGLEMIARCQEHLNPCPRFIVLSSYEEVSYLREAIRRHTLDYLIKLELSETSLTQVILKAKEEIRPLPRDDFQSHSDSSLKEAFFLRLLNDLWDQETEKELQKRAGHFGLKGHWVYPVMVETSFPDKQNLQDQERSRLVISAMQMIEETLKRQENLVLVPLSMNRFTLLISFDEDEKNQVQTRLKEELVHSFHQVKKFFNLTLSAGAGRAAQSMIELPRRYQEARHVLDQMLESESRGEFCFFCSTEKSYCQQVLEQVSDYLDQHYLNNPDLRDIAAHFHMSPNYLSSLFKKHQQQGIPAYLNQKKIEKAQELLRMNRYKIYEISEMAGFDSPYYFSKVFKKVTGVSPREWLLTQSLIEISL